MVLVDTLYLGTWTLRDDAHFGAACQKDLLWAGRQGVVESQQVFPRGPRYLAIQELQPQKP